MKNKLGLWQSQKGATNELAHKTTSPQVGCLVVFHSVYLDPHLRGGGVMQPETKAYFERLLNLINRTRVEFGEFNSKIQVANKWLEARDTVTIPVLTLQEFCWALTDRLGADWVLPGHRERIKNNKPLLVTLYMGPVSIESFVKAFDQDKETENDSRTVG